MLDKYMNDIGIQKTLTFEQEQILFYNSSGKGQANERMTREKLQQPDVRWVSPKKAELMEDYTYVSNKQILIIKTGFIFDGASIPRIFWSTLGLTPSGIMELPSLIHDYLYSFRGSTVSGRLSRKESDKIFLQVMKDVGISKTKRNIAYRAVRWFGGSSWGK